MRRRTHQTSHHGLKWYCLTFLLCAFVLFTTRLLFLGQETENPEAPAGCKEWTVLHQD